MTKRIFPILALALSLAACSAPQRAVEVTLSEQELYDKIRGGWAGQTIGVVFGAPTEFKFTGTTIQDYQPIPWSEHYVKYWWDKKPGLFDDIYNDLTFVETFEQEGLDCTTETLARRFAFAEYHLAHANQAGRYNIRNGIMPPASGNWVNNPHADDLDFQIEADFIGLMTPGLMPEALDIASRVGHIMNSGDGFYGGAFVAGLYAAAFISNDPAEVLDMALEPIPHQSTFYQCVDEVRRLYREYPDDWQQCWFEMHKRWNRDVGCPKGVFLSFNIDAKINAAYVAIGLLYGGGLRPVDGNRHALRAGFGLQPGNRRRRAGRDEGLFEHPGVLACAAERNRVAQLQRHRRLARKGLFDELQAGARDGAPRRRQGGRRAGDHPRA